MNAPTTAGTEPEGRGLQPPAFNRPSPALPARADRDYARFFTLQAPDDSTGDHGQDDPAKHR